MIKIFCEENNKFYTEIADCANRYLGVNGSCSVELIITDASEIRKLNLDFRGIDKETDVLSFPSIDFSEGLKRFDKKNYAVDFDDESGTVALGSIVINKEMAEMQAKEYGHSFERENAYLFLHGLMHIFGYDHQNESEKMIMRNLEEKVLKKIGLSVGE